MAAKGSAVAMLPGLLPGAPGQGQAPARQLPKEIAEVSLDLHRIHKWDNSNGDTWDPFWADDGRLYSFNCDGRGFGARSMNLAFNRLSGDSPESLTGVQVNAMEEYGKGSQKGPDGATWKACGQECIDGVFYAFVSRNVYGRDSKDPLLRQLAMNSSLIKSTDRGLTWSRTAQQNYDTPMWPGRLFGAPFFIHYGRDGGQVSRDGARRYVYAVSTDGFWNDGDALILARVRRSQLAALHAEDWEYHTGGDGASDANWSRQIESAVPILRRAGKCGQTPICYIPALGSYLLISWYNTALMTKWFEPNEMRYDFYQAPRPWGPWTQVGSHSDRFMGGNYHMYGPSLCARFQRREGASVRISLFTAGCPFPDIPINPYKIWHIPVLLRTSALPKSVTITASDPQIRYRGAWNPFVAASGTHGGQALASAAQGDSAELSFQGSGIEYIACKAKGQGRVEISLDGVRESANLDLEDFAGFSGVVIFGRYQLPAGPHQIRVASRSATPVNLQAFRVYE
ncbi:MAG TPA: hypothetical protein VGR96_06415 [Acidobacteriaceae bacterium]|nr:hypothetical protein [Acidobacteriaceae bacterium]